MLSSGHVVVKTDMVAVKLHFRRGDRLIANGLIRVAQVLSEKLLSNTIILGEHILGDMVSWLTGTDFPEHSMYSTIISHYHSWLLKH